MNTSPYHCKSPVKKFISMINAQGGREKGMATEIRMDERGQKKQGQVNCGAKGEGYYHESGRY